jgi:hypothetical protein
VSSQSLTTSQVQQVQAVLSANQTNPAATWSALAGMGDQYAQAALQVLTNSSSLCGRTAARHIPKQPGRAGRSGSGTCRMRSLHSAVRGLILIEKAKYGKTTLTLAPARAIFEEVALEMRRQIRTGAWLPKLR